MPDVQEEVVEAGTPVEKITVKETKEMLVAANELSLFMVGRLSDGVDFGDFTAFYEKMTKDEAFQKILRDAWEGRRKIKAEVGDIDFSEGIELVNLQASYVPKFINVLKKTPEGGVVSE